MLAGGPDKMIKALLIDLDNTLYAYEPCNKAGKKAAEELLASKTNHSVTAVRSAVAEGRRQVHADIQDGSSHSRLLYFQKAIEFLKGKTDCCLSLQADAVFWQAYFDSMKLFEGVTQLFTLLHSRDIKIIVISDLTARIQLKKIIRLGIDTHIDFLVTSEESDCEKPGAAIFQLALQKAALIPSEVIMVGDSYKKDVESAQQLSIQAFHLAEPTDAAFNRIAQEIIRYI